MASATKTVAAAAVALALVLFVSWCLRRDGARSALLERHRVADSVATAVYASQRDSALRVARSSDSARGEAVRALRAYTARRARVVVRVDTMLAGVDTGGSAPDTVVVAPVVAELLASADSTIAAQGAALHADSVAIAALRSSLSAADTALVVRARRIDALEGALRARRKPPWKSVALAFAAGAIVAMGVSR